MGLTKVTYPMIEGAPVNPLAFGVVADGVTDDTTALLAAHTYANTNDLEVSYSGIATMAVQAGAQIPVKTSVDFCECQFVLLNGVNTPPSINTFNDLFVVTDDTCPLVTVTGAVDSGDLVQGSLTPTKGLFDGHGYAKLSCAYQVPNRAETSTDNYVQTFKINRVGVASHPLSTDLSAYAAAITVMYRKTSKTCLTIKNLSVIDNGWNNQRLLIISRCNISIENVTVLSDIAGKYPDVSALIDINDSSDISIDNFITTGRPTSVGGSYALNMNGVADVYINKMNAVTGWGATGCNYLNGVHYTNCVINRIDTHCSGHNIFVDNCDMQETGVHYGWGGGIISVKNSRAYQTAFIRCRGDYGGTFFGDFVIENCEANDPSTAAYYVINLLSNPLGASSPVYAPTTITVNNVRRVGAANANSAPIIPVALEIKNASSVVYAPAFINISNITCSMTWRFGLYIDILNLENNPIFNRTTYSINNVHASVQASTLYCIREFANIRTPADPVVLTIRASSCSNIYVDTALTNGPTMVFNNCLMNGISVDTAAATQPQINITACRFLSPATSLASPYPIGGGKTGNNNYTTLINCEFSGNVWDLSLASALQGITVRNSSLSPTLPAGATFATAFTGWQAAGAFQ